VFVGRLAMEKNVETLLRNLRKFWLDGVRADFDRRDGPDRRALLAYAEELGVAGRTTFTGYLSWPRR
jgi:glycosyltransferase involved in cell wall biosynthesis